MSPEPVLQKAQREGLIAPKRFDLVGNKPEVLILNLLENQIQEGVALLYMVTNLKNDSHKNVV